MEDWLQNFDWGSVGKAAVNASGEIPVNNTENMPSQQTGADWWSGDNISGYTDSLATIFQIFSGKPKGPDTVIYQNDTEPQKSGGLSSGALVGIIVGVILLFVLILFLVIRRPKK